MYSVVYIDLERCSDRDAQTTCAWYRICVLRHNYREFEDESPSETVTSLPSINTETTTTSFSALPSLNTPPYSGWQETVASKLLQDLTSMSARQTAPAQREDLPQADRRTGHEGSSGQRFLLHPDSLTPLMVHSDENLSSLLSSSPCPDRATSLSNWAETQQEMRILLGRDVTRDDQRDVTRDSREGESLARVRAAVAELSTSLSKASDNLLQVWDLQDLEDDTKEMLAPQAEDRGATGRVNNATSVCSTLNSEAAPACPPGNDRDAESKIRELNLLQMQCGKMCRQEESGFEDPEGHSPSDCPLHESNPAQDTCEAVLPEVLGAAAIRWSLRRSFGVLKQNWLQSQRTAARVGAPSPRNGALCISPRVVCRRRGLLRAVSCHISCTYGASLMDEWRGGEIAPGRLRKGLI